MRSIAVWLEPNEKVNATPENIELHFNLWKLPSTNGNYDRFLDIGIKLERTDIFQRLNLYFPFRIHKEEILDIVNNFINNNALVGAIFNENYKVESQPSSKLYCIRKQQGDFVFNIYKLDSSDISIEQKYNGTIVYIKLPSYNQSTYFRIRIKGKYGQSLSLIQKPSNSFFQSAFSKTELIDFRVNEVRDLDYSLLEEVNERQTVLITKIHCFFICSSDEDIINSHTPFLSCRNLEKDKWTQYIGQNALDENSTYLAYHWRGKNVIDFAILIKTKFENSNWKTILIYLLIIFFLSICFNLISSFIFAHINSK